MRRSLADGSGYVSIDHRDSPGLTAADVAHVPGALAVPGGTLLERDAQQCSHCQRLVVLNPGRIRARAVCQKCHHYICDTCEAMRAASGGACVPFKQILDRAGDIAEKFAHDPTHPDAVLDLDALRVQNPTVSVPADVRPRITLTD